MTNKLDNFSFPTSTSMFPCNRVSTAMFFKIWYFPLKKDTYFYFYFLDYRITIKLAIFYQINYNCLCDLGYLVTDLRKKLECTITKQQMLGSVFNSMNFSRNFTIGGFFCSKPSFYTSRNGTNSVNSEWRIQGGGWFQFTLRGKINGIWTPPINSTK